MLEVVTERKGLETQEKPEKEPHKRDTSSFSSVAEDKLAIHDARRIMMVGGGDGAGL
ncbi:MAG: hypothetical protein RBR63_05930 [Methanosarcina vacuolata]|jgi:hypothetical protein|nr:hypothetical protein [Methanosarcina vacuolata]